MLPLASVSLCQALYRTLGSLIQEIHSVGVPHPTRSFWVKHKNALPNSGTHLDRLGACARFRFLSEVAATDFGSGLQVAGANNQGTVPVDVLSGPNTGPSCGPGPCALALRERSMRIIGSCHVCRLDNRVSTLSCVERCMITSCFLQLKETCFE